MGYTVQNTIFRPLKVLQLIFYHISYEKFLNWSEKEISESAQIFVCSKLAKSGQLFYEQLFSGKK